MQYLSLKTKMTCVVFLLMAGMLSVMALLAFSFFESEFRETVARHQFSMVTAVAEEIDGRLQAAQGQLTAVAGGMTRGLLADPSQAGRYLSGQAAALATFDNGLYLFSSEGRMLTGTGMEPHMWGKDYSYREYYQVTASTGKPFISKPFVSTQGHGHPIIVLTVPIFDARGGLAAILGGSLDLAQKNFLDKLAGIRIGQGGYFYLFNTDRIMILHPDRSRILKKDVPVGANRLFDRAIEGFEGSGETVNSRGLNALASFKRLKTTDWILAANFPVAEAYAPIARARSIFLGGLAGMLALAVLIVWLFMGRLTKPLIQITGRARQVAEGETDLPPLKVAARDEIGILAGAFDRMLAELEQRKGELGEQKDFAEALVQHAAAPIFVLDRRQRVIVWNRAIEELTGLAAAEVKETSDHWRAFYDRQRPCLADFVINGEKEGLDCYYEIQNRSSLVEEGLRAEGWRTLQNGRHCYLTFCAAPIRNSRREIVAAIQTLEDLTERKEAERRMEQLAHFDSLTGLPNRALFFDRLGLGLRTARRFRHELALLYIDLDGFKRVNDTAGHQAGDQVLAEVARRLEACVRETDTVGRIGGDEFAAVLGRVEGEDGARLVVERILDALLQPFMTDGGSFTVGASIGISLFPAVGGDADSLMRKADAAMYQVKAQGKNSFIFYREKNRRQ